MIADPVAPGLVNTGVWDIMTIKTATPRNPSSAGTTPSRRTARVELIPPVGPIATKYPTHKSYSLGPLRSGRSLLGLTARGHETRVADLMNGIWAYVGPPG